MTENAIKPLTLALETSGDVCSVALLHGEELLTELIFRHSMHLSEKLMTHIDLILRESGFELESVSDFAAGVGPGSFTGTRIGVMTLKTLSYLTGKPIWGIGSLDTIAFEYRGLKRTLIVPMIPCRKGTVFAGGYQSDASAPQTLLKPDAYLLEDMGREVAEKLRELQLESVLFCGPAVEKYEFELAALSKELDFNMALGSVRYPRASSVGQMAYLSSLEGASPGDAISLVPLYISPPPITMPKVRV